MRAHCKAVAAAVLLAAACAAAVIAQHVPSASTFTYTRNMVPIGESLRTVSPANPRIFNSDLAFWENYAFQGTFEGFRIIDISAPARPRELVNFTDCVQGTTTGNQGDIVVWGGLLVRSWNSPAPAGGATCGGLPVSAGQQGVHIFDISNPVSPIGLALVETQCGSHTATAVPDLENDRLLVYSSSNSTICPWIDIIEVPLSNPAGAVLLRTGFTQRPCHDIGVILGDAMRAACAGGNGFSVLSLDAADGGSLEDPILLHSQAVPFVTTGHSAAFTWDGAVLIFGHEPGGGVEPSCQASTPEANRSLFFFDTETGVLLGRFVHPRAQTATENCAWHNYNVMPTSQGYFLVSGNYQSGISVIDFTDLANPREVAYADPAPLVNPEDPTAILVGGDWSSYWYNGFIYESDMTRGLLVWRLNDPVVAATLRLPHMNPQTQEFTIR